MSHPTAAHLFEGSPFIAETGTKAARAPHTFNNETQLHVTSEHRRFLCNQVYGDAVPCKFANTVPSR